MHAGQTLGFRLGSLLAGAWLAVAFALPGEAKIKSSGLAVRPISVPAQIEPQRGWGVGLMLGDMTGVNGKYWLDDSHALDVAVGAPIGSVIGAQASYLLHLRPFEEAPEAPLYLGAGLFLGGGGDVFSAGFRGSFGIAYHFEEPFDIFIEVSPKLYFIPEVDFGMGLSIGGRIYFGN